MLIGKLRAAVAEGLGEEIADAVNDALDRKVGSPSSEGALSVRIIDPGTLQDPTAATRVFLRPLANPLSLGFLGVFVGTLALTAIQLGWVPVTQTHTIAESILVLTAPVQLIACVYGFLARDMVAATGMGVQAGMWGFIGLNLLLGRPGATSSGLAFILVVGAAALCMPALGALRGKALAGGVLLTTAVRWVATAGYEFSGSSVAETVAGAVGIALALAALYASLAFELEDQQRSTVLATLRRGKGAAAMQEPLPAQVRQIANEAGVRRQL